MHPSLAAFEVTGPLTRRSTPAELDAVAADLGMPVPPSYRELAEELGYGRLFPGVGLLFFIPMEGFGDTLADRSSDLFALFRESIDLDLWEYEPDGSLDLVQRLVPFGISETGMTFAWDPRDDAGDESGDGERWIYTIGSKMLGVFRVAPDLYSFLDACQDDRVKHVLGPGYRPQVATFVPLTPQP